MEKHHPSGQMPCPIALSASASNVSCNSLDHAHLIVEKLNLIIDQALKPILSGLAHKEAPLDDTDEHLRAHVRLALLAVPQR